MLKVFIHNGPPSKRSPFNQLGRMDIGYEKLDAYADYKVVMTQAGVGEYPLATVKDYPRWTASIWDLVMRAICSCLWLEEVLPPLGVARRGAYAEHLTVIVEHWPDGFEQGRAIVGMAEIKMNHRRCRYVATFDDDILGGQASTEFTHTPDVLNPWDLVARAYAWTVHQSFKVPPRPALYTKLTIEEDGKTLVPTDMVKEPARTGLVRWMMSKGLQPQASKLISGPCVTEATYIDFLRRAI